MKNEYIAKALCSIGGILFGMGIGITYDETEMRQLKQQQAFRESTILHQGYWSGVHAALDNVHVNKTNCTFSVEMETLIEIDNKLPIINYDSSYTIRTNRVP